MKKKLLFIIIFTISFGNIIWSENEPNNNIPLNEPNLKILSDNEIKIIDEVIKHIVTFELEKTMKDLQICINNTFYVDTPSAQNEYENTLRNSFNYLKKQFMIEDNIILSFIENNIKKREVDKNVIFNSDVFWMGTRPTKSFIVMIFSNIGFNQNETEALVHVVVNLPAFMFGEYIYLQKEDGEWKFKKCVESWMT
jgi:hypothetical protein